MAFKDLSLDIRRAIERYAAQYNFDPELIASIVDQESGGDPNAVSNAGAQGLMQTVGEAPISDALRTGLLKARPDTSTIDGQVQAGTAYLAYLRDFEKAPSLEHLLMMYNGGPKMKNANPTSTAAELKSFVAQRYGGDFDGAQNAGYRDSILETYKQSGGDFQNFGFKQNAATEQLGLTVKIEGGSDSSGPLQNSTSADTSTGIDSAPLSTQARNTSQAQPTSTAATNDGTARLDPAILEEPENTDVAQLSSAFDTADQSIRRQIQFQNSALEDFDRNVDNLPAEPNYQDLLSSTLTQLEGYSAQNRQLTNDAFEQLVANDAERRSITQNLSERIDYDPTDPQSLLQGVLQDQVRLQKRLRATQVARQAVNDAPIGSAGYFRRLIFGNEYARGEQDLVQMSNNQRRVFDNTVATLNTQIELAENANISDPQLLRDKLNADIRLNNADSAIAVQEANLTQQFHNAEMRNAELALGRDKTRLDAQLRIGQTELKAAELGIQRVDAEAKARDRPIARKQALATLESTELRIQGVKQERQLDEVLRESRQAFEALKIKAGTQELQAQMAELKRDRERLADPEYLKTLDNAQRIELKKRVAESQLAIAKAAELERTGSVSTSVAASNAAQNATITEAQQLRVSQDRQKYAWNEVLGNTNADGSEAPVPINLPREDQLSLELIAGGKAAANNPIEAVQQLNKLNALKPRGSQDTERSILQGTASVVLKAVANRPEFSDPRVVKNMSTAEFQRVVGDLVNKPTNITNSATGARNIGGVLPAPIISAYAPDSKTGTFLDSQGEAFDTALSYTDKIDVALAYAKETLGMSTLTDRSNFVTGVFIAATKANNALRGYQLIGLPQQKGIVVVDDSTTFLGFGDDISTDLTKAPQVARYMATLDARKAARQAIEEQEEQVLDLGPGRQVDVSGQ